ncbi:LysR substrate-binding domain-containing protein [Stenotrophomonas mori]|uniref:LysR family transcriptional regulator n=1 Tax=Stenotrophomonas mori TaxID=2871096 RepID=A0ABT0SEK8_9GAMM|nr:LysR family transcriptional regulator [Stenotrophomonas mori]
MANDLNDTLIFVKVVEQGSFTAAARLLGQPKTTVSRKVQELEARLGARLLHRTTRRLGLTEAGTVYYEHCKRIARELEQAESAVNQLQSGPRGWLRFSVPYSVGTTWIAPLLGRFQAQYPDIRVDMHLGDETLDLISGEIDMALRIGPLPDSNLIARKLGRLRTQVFASPGYIRCYGEPAHPDELRHHRTLAVRNAQQSQGNRFAWPLAQDGGAMQEFPVEPLLVANDASALNAMLVAGEGLMLSSDVMAKPFIESGMLRRVLAGWTGPDYDFSAVFAGGGMVSPKVRAFVDFLVDKLNLDANYMLLQCPNAKRPPGAQHNCQRGLEIPVLPVREALSA